MSESCEYGDETASSGATDLVTFVSSKPANRRLQAAITTITVTITRLKGGKRKKVKEKTDERAEYRPGQKELTKNETRMWKEKNATSKGKSRRK